MRILVVTQYYRPETFWINEITEGLRALDHTVDVLTTKPNYPNGRIYSTYSVFGQTQETINGIDVFRVPVIPRGNGSSWRLALNYLGFVLLASLLGPIRLKGRKYDVVFAFLPSPVLAAIPAVLLRTLKRARLVLWVQDLWPESIAHRLESRYVMSALRRIVGWIYRRADRILVPSRAFVDPVAALLNRPETDDRIHYYPNSFNPPETTPANMNHHRVPELQKDFCVVFAGNLGHAQGLEEILIAAHVLKSKPDIKFILIGDGSAADNLKSRISSEALDNILVYPRLPLEVMPGVFMQASALLIALSPRKIFDYTVPSKLQAYMAAGRPIIAWVNGETARIVTEAQAGLTCEAGDGSNLAASVLKLYGMPDSERSRMSDNALAYFDQHYRPSKLIETLPQLLS